VHDNMGNLREMGEFSNAYEEAIWRIWNGY
jgi:hypothetical protein